MSAENEQVIRLKVGNAIDAALDRVFEVLDRQYTSAEIETALTFHDVDLVEAWLDWSEE